MELKLHIEYHKLLELINQLPNHLREQLKADLSETPNDDENKTKEKLADLIKARRAEPIFTNIEDPVAWQKNLRNEWES